MLHFRLSPDTELRLLEPRHAEELLAPLGERVLLAGRAVTVLRGELRA